MSKLDSILRIIDGARNNDIEMILRYSKNIVGNDEWETTEKCIREAFSNENSETIMDKDAKIEELKDELDALNMRYLSQVGLYKSLYQELKAKENKHTKRFYESILDDKVKKTVKINRDFTK